MLSSAFPLLPQAVSERIIIAARTRINAFLLERFNVRGLFFIAILTFIIGCVIMALGDCFIVVLIGRIFQALGAGILTPMAIGVMMIIYPKEKRGHAQGIYGVITGLGPALGPAVSGFIVTDFG